MRTDEYDVRIDRATRWGNPYKMSSTLSRRKAISLYREYLSSLLADEVITKTDIRSLQGLRLGCWCAPLPCHGDVLAELADQLDSSPRF